MNFKKPKEEVISSAASAADGVLGVAFSNLKYNLMHNSQSNNLEHLQKAISFAIYEAVKSLVNNTYTDQEFEEDVGIK